MNQQKISLFRSASVALFALFFFACEGEKVNVTNDFLKIMSVSISGTVAPLDNIYASDTFETDQQPTFDLTFSAQLATSSIKTSEYELIDDKSGTNIPLQVFISGGNTKVLKIVTAKKLEFNVSYTLKVSASLSSTSGLGLLEEQKNLTIHIHTQDGYAIPSAPEKPVAQKVLKDSIVLSWGHDGNFGKDIKGTPITGANASFSVLISTDGVNFTNTAPTYNVSIENKQAIISQLSPQKNYYFKVVASNNNPVLNTATSVSSDKITTASGSASPSQGKVLSINQVDASSDILVSFFHDGNFGKNVNGNEVSGTYSLEMTQNGVAKIIASTVPSTSQSFTISKSLLPVNSAVTFRLVVENTEKNAVRSEASPAFIKKSISLTNISNLPDNNSLFSNQQHIFSTNIIAFGGASNQVEFKITSPTSGLGSSSSISNSGIFIPEAITANSAKNTYGVTIEAVSKEDPTQRAVYNFIVLSTNALTEKPATPDFSATLGINTKTQVVLDWSSHTSFGKDVLGNNATPATTAYKIYLSSTGTNFSLLPTDKILLTPTSLTSSVKSTTISGLTPNTSYTFRIVASNTNTDPSFNTSLYVEKTIKTDSDLTPPSSASVSTITQASSTANITVAFSHDGNWGKKADGSSASANTQAAYQLLAINSSKSSTLLSASDATLNLTAKTFSINPSTLNTSAYTFKVITVNDINQTTQSAESTPFTKKTITLTKITNTPAQDAMYSNNTVQFSTDINTTGGASNEVLFAITAPTSGLGATSTISATGLFTPANLTAGTSFSVTIKASSKENPTLFANYTFTVSAPPVSYDKIKSPAIPVLSFSTTPSNPKNQVILNWTHTDFGKDLNGNNAIPADTAYRIEFSINGTNFFSLPSASISFSPLKLQSTVQSATISGLTPNTTYWFRLTAVNQNTETAYKQASNTSASVTTAKDNAPPSAPSNFAISQASPASNVIIKLTHDGNWGKADDGSPASPANVAYDVQATSSGTTERIPQQYYTVSARRDSITINKSFFDPSKTYDFIIAAVNNFAVSTPANYTAGFVLKSLNLAAITGKPLRDSSNSLATIQFGVAITQTGNVSTDVQYAITAPTSGLGAKSTLSATGLFTPEAIATSDLTSAYIVTIKVTAVADPSKSLTYQFTINNKANNLSQKPATPDFSTTATSTTEITLDWSSHTDFGKDILGKTAVAKDTAYKIYLSSNGTNFSLLPTSAYTLTPAKLSSTTKSVKIGGLTSGIVYWFRVLAFNQNGAEELYSTSAYIQKTQSTLINATAPSKAVVSTVTQASSTQDILLTFTHDGNFGKRPDQTNATASSQNTYQIEVTPKNGTAKVLSATEATINTTTKTATLNLSTFTYSDTVTLRVLVINDQNATSKSDGFKFLRKSIAITAIGNKPLHDSLLHTQTAQFTATVSPLGGANSAVTFELISPTTGTGAKSTISSAGLFTPESLGTGTTAASYIVSIQVKSVEDPTQKLTYQFTVYKPAELVSQATAPDVPSFSTSITEVNAETQINLNWATHTGFGKNTLGGTATPDTPAYTIDISTDGTTFTALPTNIISFSPTILYSTVKSATISNLTPNSFYWFRLTARNKNTETGKKTASYTSPQAIKTAQHMSANFSAPQIVGITQSDATSDIVLSFSHDGNWGDGATPSTTDAYRLKYTTKQGAVSLIASNQISVNTTSKTITILKVALPSDSCSFVLTLQNSKGETVSSLASKYFAKISSRPVISNTKRIVLGYYRSYGGSSDLLKKLRELPPSINHVFLSFVKPNMRYTKYSYKTSRETTGLEFEESTSCELISTIKVLKDRDVKVIISVGGESYWGTNEAYNIDYQQIKDFVDDFGFSGIDWDYEPNGTMPNTQDQVDKMTAMIRNSRAIMPKGQYIIACAPAGVGALGGKNFDDASSPYAYSKRNSLTGESDANLNKNLEPNQGISLFGFGSTGHMIPTMKAVGNMIDIVAYQGYNTGGATRRTLMYDAYAHYAQEYGFSVAAGIHVPYEPYPNDRKGGYIYTHDNVADLSLYIHSGGSGGSRASSYDGIMMWELLTPNQFEATQTAYSFMQVASNIFAGQSKADAITNSADVLYPFTGTLPACSQVTYCGVSPWSSGNFNTGQQVYLNGKIYSAKYTTSAVPGGSEDWTYVRECTDIPEGELPPSGILDNNTTTTQPSKPLILSIEQADGSSNVKVYFDHSEYWGRTANSTPDVAGTPPYKVELTVGTTVSILSSADVTFVGKMASINPSVLPKYNCTIAILAYNSQGLSAKSDAKTFTKEPVLYCGAQEWTSQDPAYSTGGTTIYYNGTLWQNAYYASSGDVPGVASVWVNKGPCASDIITLLSPAADAVNSSTLPSFSWQAPSSVASGTSLNYTIYVDTSNTFSHPTTFASTTTSFTPTQSLLFSKTYYWKVNAIYNGKTYSSAVKAFTTLDDPNQPPTITISKPSSNQLSFTSPTNTIQVEATIVDAETQVASVVASVNNATLTLTKNGNVYTGSFQTTVFGKYLISITAKDDANKSRTLTKEITVLDQNSPIPVKPDAPNLLSIAQTDGNSDIVLTFTHSGLWGSSGGINATAKASDSFVVEVKSGTTRFYVSPYSFGTTTAGRTASVKQNLVPTSSTNTYDFTLLAINSNNDTSRSTTTSFTRKVVAVASNGYCGRTLWTAKTYPTTDTVYYKSKLWKNKWYANSSDEPSVADVWQFVSDCKQNEVVLSTPQNGFSGLTLSPTLSWSAPTIIADPSQLVYSVYVDTSSAFSSPIAIINTNVAATSLAISNLRYEQKYYWKVTTTQNGTTYTSIVHTFTTLPDPNQAPSITLKQPTSTQIGLSTPSSTVTIAFDAIDAETVVSSATATIDGQSISLTKTNNTYTGNFVTSKGYATYILVINATDNAGKTRSITKNLWVYDQSNKPAYSPIPDKVLVGYWHNWQNTSAPFMKLTDIPASYNVVNVSFIETESGAPYKAVFSPTAPYTKDQFKQDIQTLKDQGKKVMISIGGENGKIHLLTDAQKDTFVSTVTQIVRDYGFDGIDIDYEGASISPLQNTSGTGLTMDKITNEELKRGITAIREIYDNFGSGFMITAAPEVYYVQYGLSTYPGAGQFLAFLEGLRDILAFVQVQLYNTGSMTALDNKAYSRGTPDLVVAASEMLLQGFDLSNTGIHFNALRPDQVVVGLPASPSAGGGYIVPDKLIQGMNYLIHGTKGTDLTYTLVNPSGYANLRGMMTWSINWDKSTDGGTAVYEYASIYNHIFNGGPKP